MHRAISILILSPNIFYKKPVPNLKPFTHSSLASDSVDMHPFTPEDVWARHKAAPGDDRLTYQHWRSVDPDAKVLSVIFNICLGKACSGLLENNEDYPTV